MGFCSQTLKSTCLHFFSALTPYVVYQIRVPSPKAVWGGMLSLTGVSSFPGADNANVSQSAG